MTLLERLAALPEISPQTIKENFTFEDFKFEILEAMDKEPDYAPIHALFHEVEATLNDDPLYNIFNERYVLKSLYLSQVYNIPLDLFSYMLNVEPIVKLDKRLFNEVLQNDELFIYVEGLYKEYRTNNNNALETVIKYMNTIDVQELSKELEGQISKLQDIAK